METTKTRPTAWRRGMGVAWKGLKYSAPWVTFAWVNTISNKAPNHITLKDVGIDVGIGVLAGVPIGVAASAGYARLKKLIRGGDQPGGG
jgi:hypothetical protein